MTTSHWIVRLFQVSDLEAQRLILGLLDQVDELVAEGCEIGGAPYITVETREITQATSTRQLILAIDPAARMLHTASRHPDPARRAAQMIAAGTAVDTRSDLQLSHQ